MDGGKKEKGAPAHQSTGKSKGLRNLQGCRLTQFVVAMGGKRQRKTEEMATEMASLRKQSIQQRRVLFGLLSLRATWQC